MGRVSDERRAALGGTLDRLTAEIRRRAPHARVFLVDYLTILPPDDRDTGALPSEASREHHAWAPSPWTRQFHYSLRGGAPYRPNLPGMQAVADLLTARALVN